MFGFGLQKSILAFDKALITENAQKILCETPKGKEQLIFIENHDIDRFASLDFPLEKQKTAAALMLLMGGVPSIYYGQEIGMKGKVYSFGNTDGNDIGRREAFEWYQTGQGDGMSYWYKNSGAWWTNANSKPNDGISMEEQRNNPNSLFNWYKAMIALKQSNAALAIGSYENVPNENQHVFSFYRIQGHKKVLVVANLSPENQQVLFKQDFKKATNLLDKKIPFEKQMNLLPYEVRVWEVK
jgi:glycosidase